MKADTDGLELYCATDHQRRVLDTVNQSTSQQEAADKLGIAVRNVQAMLKRLRDKRDAVEQGYAPPPDEIVPPGQSLQGQSTYTKDEFGNKVWYKFSKDKAATEQALEDMREAFASTLPREKPVKARKSKNDDLLNLFIITDYHLGMLSWGEETGADWDLQIAEDMLYSWFREAQKMAPRADTAVIGQLGDLLHYDSMESITPASGHILDADSRFQKVVRVAIRAFRRVVRHLLKTHQKVHMIHAEGNHDPASSIWLRELFSALYEDEPRVTVELSPDPYYCYEFGDTSLFFHHGHKKRVQNIDDVFVAKFREVFGRTKYSYAHMGHLHHDDAKDTNLMRVRQHRTLAAPDAYASRGGWLSDRSANVHTYHKQFGELGRFTVPSRML